MSDYESYRIPRRPLSTEEVTPEGANVATIITKYRCPCRKGKVANERVPGFGDDYYVIECPVCDEKYAYVERVGYHLYYYLNKRTKE